MENWIIGVITFVALWEVFYITLVRVMKDDNTWLENKLYSGMITGMVFIVAAAVLSITSEFTKDDLKTTLLVMLYIMIVPGFLILNRYISYVINHKEVKKKK